MEWLCQSRACEQSDFAYRYIGKFAQQSQVSESFDVTVSGNSFTSPEISPELSFGVLVW